jgi:hypothetical protein
LTPAEIEARNGNLMWNFVTYQNPAQSSFPSCSKPRGVRVFGRRTGADVRGRRRSKEEEEEVVMFGADEFAVVSTVG